MTANNVIYIQKRNNRYWVWMGDGDETEHAPAKCDAKFYYSADAWDYANDWKKNAYVNAISMLADF